MGKKNLLIVPVLVIILSWQKEHGTNGSFLRYILQHRVSTKPLKECQLHVIGNAYQRLTNTQITTVFGLFAHSQETSGIWFYGYIVLNTLIMPVCALTWAQMYCSVHILFEWGLQIQIFEQIYFRARIDRIDYKSNHGLLTG